LNASAPATARNFPHFERLSTVWLSVHHGAYRFPSGAGRYPVKIGEGFRSDPPAFHIKVPWPSSRP
jgi:hypothetical protein